ncbi:WD40 repeat domain-containing serine/threonine-protein kinase [Streptosporangium roseum]|uniref:Serine/threonine protein kinase-like protein n=1 Tax=Streptosporangium roseum (strain ATCC 12428 / DSM 43021 / JCM 3005 / KCTC 9067 / NCIMB 10171 / NRRL 2505 / NI 9100) TaxID=479432 RepID=D2B026_STRRD|nr:WD40 repeat domain-containing serine/threonine-protein kinase [Streptosporangium roseum]ACZ87260.1 Serine/threonine protein kinase-like protein [Streptosporangium roseum DSM 43021]
MVCSPLIEGDPQRIGGYALAGRLGVGGQGVVFEGYGPDGARVAIKVLHADMSALRPLDGEVAALLRVAPFCTARIVGFDLDADRPYIVSEFVPGASLRAIVQQHGPLRGDELHRLGVGIATAMVAIHRAGVVHRDLKPDNVLLSPDGPRVIDFGIARLLTGAATSGVVGTPLYMAPEVLHGAPADRAADVYGWAAVMLFAASARPPYRAQASAAGLPEPLRSLVLSGLAARPEARPEARDVLLRLLEHRPDPARLMEAGSRAAGTVGPRGNGVDPPLGERAEQVFAALPAPERAAVPGVLLRLMGPGDQLRTAPMAELGDNDPAVRAVVEALCMEGILLRSGTGVSIAAPALPVAWPRLADWLAEERPGQADHHRLGEAARMWAANGRKDADLDQGSALERDNRWAAEARRNLRLNAVERDFLAASAALAGRRVRRRRLLLVTLAVLLSLTAVLATLAETQRRVVTAQRDEAIARSVAARVPSLRTLAPSTALLAAVAAWRVSPVAEARLTLLSSLGQPDVLIQVKGAYVAVSDQGHVLSWNSNWAEVWDTGSRAKAGTIRSPGCCANAFLSPDASKLLAIDASQTITRVFDVRSGKRLGEAAAPGNSAVFSAGGSRAATFTHQSDRPISVFDLTRGTELASLSRKDVWTIGLSPDGSTLAIATEGGRVELVDVVSGRTSREFTVPKPVDEETWLREQANIDMLRFTADGTTLVSNTGELRFWDVASGSERADHAGNGLAAHVFALDASGRWMATADGQSIQLWNLPSNRSMTVMSPLPGLIDALAFTADGRGLSLLPRGLEARMIDLAPYTTPPRLYGMGEEATSAAIFPRAGRAATVAPDGVRVWDLRSLRQIGPATVFTSMPKSTSPCGGSDDGPFQAVSLSPDGSFLAVITPGDAVRVSEVATGRLVVRLPLPQGQHVAFSPDGRTLVASGIRRAPPECDEELIIQTWNADSRWRLTSTTPGARGPLAFTPDSAKLVALDNDGMVLIDPATGRITRRIDTSRLTISLLGLASDPRYALLDSRALYPVDLTTGQLLDSPLAGKHSAESIASSGDGRTLAMEDRSHRIRLLDTVTGDVTDLPLPGVPDPVRALAFSLDGRTLHALTSTGIVYTHVTDPDSAATLLCTRAGGQLARTEWERYIPQLPYRDVC